MARSFHKEMHTYLESRTVKQMRRSERRVTLREKWQTLCRWCKRMVSVQPPSLEGLTQDTTYIFQKLKSPAHQWVEKKFTKKQVEPEKPRAELSEDELKVLEAQLGNK